MFLIDPVRRFNRAEGQVIWVLWMTYGAFYFCRTNISAAVPGIEAEFGFSKTEIGLILGALKLAYGVGQFLNGQLAERYSPRKLVAIGMLGSAALNVVFGLSTGLYFLMFVWACNGYLQALGWTPCMRVAANWFSPDQRGRAIGIIGTSYQVTAAMTFIIAGWAAHQYGWRAALYLPTVLLVSSCIHMLLFMRESPWTNASGADASQDAAGRPAGHAIRSFSSNVIITLANPVLWLLAVALGMLNACRYGFMDWGLTQLVEVQATGIDKAGFKYAVLPIGGIAGAYFSGWATDRIFGGRRAPVICGLLVTLGLLTLGYNWCIHFGTGLTIITLLAIGFSMFGAQVILVGTAPIDLARAGTAAAAVGFVNFMGYIGAFSGDQVTGYLAEHYDWKVAVYFWASCAFLAAAMVALLWNATAQAGEPLTDQAGDLETARP